MKLLFIILLLIANTGYALELKLGVEPIIDPSLMEKELAPLLAFHSNDHSIHYVYSYSLKEFVSQAENQELDMAYTSGGYFYLLKRAGFIPVLKSRQDIHQVVISNPKDKQPKYDKLYFVKNDLSSMYRVRTLKNLKGKLVPTMTSEVAIFAVLKDPKAQAIIMADELGLLDSNMRSKISVNHTTNIGPVYLMMRKELISELGGWIDSLLKFHDEFRDYDEKYNYLNAYQFELFNGEDEYWGGKQEEYFRFVDGILK